MNRTKILIAAHRHPLKNLNGGAEFSVRIIMKYLRNCGYEVFLWINSGEDEVIEGFQCFSGGLESHVKASNCVLTWGRPAKQVASLCIKNNTAYVLMMRWFRNLVDVSLPIGDLMTKPINRKFQQEHQFLFDNASAVITNNYYSSDLIRHYYDVKALVSYVPIEGQSNPIANKNGYITLVSPHNNLLEKKTFIEIKNHYGSNDQYHVVNPPNGDVAEYQRANIKITPFTRNMKDIWRQSKIMVQPMYQNDICGTLRTSIEAQQHGVPVIVNMRSGIEEKVKNVIPREATMRDWIKKIHEISVNWEKYSQAAIDEFNNYDTPAQLEIFKKEIEKCV